MAETGVITAAEHAELLRMGFTVHEYCARMENAVGVQPAFVWFPWGGPSETFAYSGKYLADAAYTSEDIKEGGAGVEFDNVLVAARWLLVEVSNGL